MTNIIIVFPKQEDGRNIRNILVKNGFSVSGVCTSGAQVLQCIEELEEGIILSGYRYSDMIYAELHELLPASFQMLLVASPRYLGEVNMKDIVCVAVPIKSHELLATLGMMVEAAERKKYRRRKRAVKTRSEQDQLIIRRAKALLMERNHMTEEEAHRYIQKCSMDSGTSMTESAQMVMSLFGEV